MDLNLLISSLCKNIKSVRLSKDDDDDDIYAKIARMYQTEYNIKYSDLRSQENGTQNQASKSTQSKIMIVILVKCSHYNIFLLYFPCILMEITEKQPSGFNNFHIRNLKSSANIHYILKRDR